MKKFEHNTEQGLEKCYENRKYILTKMWENVWKNFRKTANK